MKYFRQDDKKETEAKPMKKYTEGNWIRKTSYSMGEYLKLEDEVRHTQNYQFF